MSRKKLTNDKKNYNSSSLGDRLLKAINLMNLNQKKFAEKANLLPATINGIIKSGKSPTAETLAMIHQAGVSILWLVMGEGDILVPSRDHIGAIYSERQPDQWSEKGDKVEDEKDRYQKSTLAHLLKLLSNPDQIPPAKQKAINDLIRSILELLS